ncbi:hypothetical protein FD35_GL002712 [Furfurilactobacillus rossiae DSM 15814]|uniref:Uncharacterized protein n=2 Tax=Furfurilactobacillus rossiae TaxID=231049 RepID=A0A0R1RJ79_9LACO|nr:hypothetical protein FD35_GL002712 [Furfurilactobacillus rossiae DSM 15814]
MKRGLIMTKKALVLNLLILVTALTTIFGTLFIGDNSLIVQLSYITILAEMFGYYTIFDDGN